MRGRVAEVAAVSAIALVLTLVVAAPVLRAPSDRIFGMEIVGRHHDPFTVMEQFGRPVRARGLLAAADRRARRVARAGSRARWPRTTGSSSSPFRCPPPPHIMLARHLALSPAGAAVAALAFAFSPFHLAHAAYHPHIAQTQWVPLYLLALWRCLDHSSAAAVGLLVVSIAGVTLVELLRRPDRGGRDAGGRRRVLVLRRATPATSGPSTRDHDRHAWP